MHLVIHGQTEWNRDGRTQGHRDSPLTELGRAQVARSAVKLAQRVDPVRTRIVSSPSPRAMATAAILARNLAIRSPIATDTALMELDFGDWEGKTQEEITTGWPDIIARTNAYDRLLYAPNGENYTDALARIGGWVKATKKHEHLIVVSHGIASRILRGIFADLPSREALRLEVCRETPFHLWGGEIVKLP